ncbi:hypothetical protein DFH09DRAFT_1353911, partial [Mycena vulgaris]
EKPPRPGPRAWVRLPTLCLRFALWLSCRSSNYIPRFRTRAIRIDSPGIGPAVPATLPRARRAFRAARARAQGCERREEGTGFCESGRDAPRIAGACGRLRAERVRRGGWLRAILWCLLAHALVNAEC